MFTYLVDSPGNCTTDTDKCHCHNIIVWVCNTVVVGWEGAGGGLAARYKINILNKKFLGSTNFKLLNHTSGNSINEYDILICNCCFRDGHGAYSHRAPRNPATPLHTDTHTYTHTHTHTHKRPCAVPSQSQAAGRTPSACSSSFPSLAQSTVSLRQTKSHLSLSWRSPFHSPYATDFSWIFHIHEVWRGQH